MEICRIQVDGPDGSYGLSYADWGAQTAARTVVCVHGLTRNGRDFDHLAAVLQEDARVICPDMVGRGASDPLGNPEHYALPTYVAHMLQLLAKLELTEVDWVGTSMGGLIGMGVAASKAIPLRRLVLNDIGPFIPKAALGRIHTYLGMDLRFATLDQLEAHLRDIHAEAPVFSPALQGLVIGIAIWAIYALGISTLRRSVRTVRRSEPKLGALR